MSKIIAEVFLYSRFQQFYLLNLCLIDELDTFAPDFSNVYAY
jgi:hypothetical protein